MFKHFILSTYLFIFTTIPLMAQNADAPVEMAFDMRSNGKIYVVVAVVLMVFLGLVFYLWTLDRRLKRLEK